MMTTATTNQNTSTPSRLSRLQDAKEYMLQHGWTPLTPEEEKEFHQMIAEFTNL
jgi:DNA-binding FadR family transcriptional regulator